MLESTGTEYEVTPQELYNLRREDQNLVILDCREPEELLAASFADALHVPMGHIPSRVAEIDAGKDIVVICHHGVRSLQVALWMKQKANFKQVKSLRGGIDAWAVAIDPSVGRY